MMFLKKKEPFFACLLLLQLFACKQEAARPVEVTENFLQGGISHRHFLVNGKKEGLETDYFPVGTPRIERMYKNGTQNGRTAIYYPQGQLMEVQYYGENGQKDGPDSTFYQTGELQTLLAYKAGKLNGYMRKWALSGDLFYEAKYEDDRLVEENGKPVEKTQ